MYYLKLSKATENYELDTNHPKWLGTTQFHGRRCGWCPVSPGANALFSAKDTGSWCSRCRGRGFVWESLGRWLGVTVLGKRSLCCSLLAHGQVSLRYNGVGSWWKSSVRPWVCADCGTRGWLKRCQALLSFGWLVPSRWTGQDFC